MKSLNWTVPVVALLLFAGQAAAQNEDEATGRAEATERQALEVREEEVRRRLVEAEERMAEAARQIAELTRERLPGMQQRFERRVEFLADDRPRLGVTISGDDEGPVEGVEVLGVTPGSAAAEAGLRAGDVITSVNDESLSAGNSEEANDKLIDFMGGVEDGDTLDIEYLRDGKVGTVQVEPKPVDVRVFSFGGPDRVFQLPGVPNVQVVPEAVGEMKDRFIFHWATDGWGDMELVELSEGLGRYFGTNEGLLVVSAPESTALKLEDGDVIQKIDGRAPTSVRHAMRILSSYQAGEELKLDIMRDKKRRTLEVEIPDDRSSWLMPGAAPAARPAAVPTVPRPARPVERT